MTVAQYIEYLKEMPPEAMVLMQDEDGDMRTPKLPEHHREWLTLTKRHYLRFAIESSRGAFQKEIVLL